MIGLVTFLLLSVFVLLWIPLLLEKRISPRIENLYVLVNTTIFALGMVLGILHVLEFLN